MASKNRRIEESAKELEKKLNKDGVLSEETEEMIEEGEIFLDHGIVEKESCPAVLFDGRYVGVPKKGKFHGWFVDQKAVEDLLFRFYSDVESMFQALRCAWDISEEVFRNLLGKTGVSPTDVSKEDVREKLGVEDPEKVKVEVFGEKTGYFDLTYVLAEVDGELKMVEMEGVDQKALEHLNKVPASPSGWLAKIVRQLHCELKKRGEAVVYNYRNGAPVFKNRGRGCTFVLQKEHWEKEGSVSHRQERWAVKKVTTTGMYSKSSSSPLSENQVEWLEEAIRLLPLSKPVHG